MASFTFFKHRTGGAVPSFVIVECGSIMEARKHAERILSEDGYDLIEIADGEVVVETVPSDRSAA